MSDYKVKLGILLDTSNLKKQIDENNNKHKIKLGVDLKNSEIRKQISSFNANSNNIKVRLGVKLDTKDLKAQINKISGLNAGIGKGVSIPVNTKSLEQSLREVSVLVKDVKTSIGTLDNKSGMNSLLTSINQISSALSKVAAQFDAIQADIRAISGKSFNLNFGLTMGGSNNPIARNAAYGSMVRGETIPQLQQQVAALEGYLQRYYKVADGFNAVQKLIQGTNVATGANHPMTLLPQMADGSNLSRQMTAYKQYIALIQKAASLKGVDLSSVTSQFTKSANELVTDAQKIQTGASEMDTAFNKLKQIFNGGSGLNTSALSAQLDSIVVDLGEIKVALQGLSSGTSLQGLVSSFDKLSTSIEKMIANANNAKAAMSNMTNTSNGSTSGAAGGVKKMSDELAAAYSKLMNIRKNIDSVKISLSGGLDASRDIQTIRTLERQLESLQNEYNETKAVINNKGGLSSKQWQDIQNHVDTTGLKLDQLKAKLTDAKNKLASGITLKLANGTYENDVSRITTQFNNLHNQTDKLRVGIDTVKAALNSMVNASAKGNKDALINAEQNYLRVLKAVENQLRMNTSAERENASITKLAGDRTAFQTQIDNWLKKNSASAKEFGARLMELKKQAQSCDRATLNKLQTEFRKVAREAELAGRKTQTLSDRLKNQFSKYSAYFSVASAFMYARMAIRDMFNEVVTIDKAMTELKKVTDETSDSYNKFLQNAEIRAKEIGSTIDGLVSSTADFARLGFSFKDSQGLAEIANIYAVVGDEVEGVEGATKSLISTMTAFSEQADGMSNSEFAMDIIDKFNEVGKLIA